MQRTSYYSGGYLSNIFCNKSATVHSVSDEKMDVSCLHVSSHFSSDKACEAGTVPAASDRSIEDAAYVRSRDGHSVRYSTKQQSCQVEYARGLMGTGL